MKRTKIILEIASYFLWGGAFGLLCTMFMDGWNIHTFYDTIAFALDGTVCYAIEELIDIIDNFKK